MEVILYSKECNWYTRCCPLNGGVRYRECPLREAILYLYGVYMYNSVYLRLNNVHVHVHVHCTCISVPIIGRREELVT